MRALRPIVATLALVAALAAVVLLSVRYRAPAPTPTAAEPAPPTPVPGKLVLFFPGDDSFLHREARDVPELPTGTAARIRLVFDELSAGSREGFAPVFPWTASVQAVFVDREGDAFVDLSSPPPDIPSGSEIETTLAFATVNSVVANCPGVRRVQLLFGGHEVATLGHLDLSEPLAPSTEVVAP